MFYPLLCTSFAIKADDYNGKDFHFYHKMKYNAAGKPLEQCFLEEFKAIYENSGESELKQLKGNLKCYLVMLSALQ